jgi:hypothetical protein
MRRSKRARCLLSACRNFALWELGVNKVNFTAMLASLAVGCLLVLKPVASQTVYRAVDELGNPAFTDRAEEYEGAEEISITVAAARERRLSRERTMQINAEATASDDADDKYMTFAKGVRESQAAEDAVAEAQQQDVRQANCDKATKRLDKYKSARRLYRENDNGEREYLSDEQTDTARADAARKVDQWCGG